MTPEPLEERLRSDLRSIAAQVPQTGPPAAMAGRSFRRWRIAASAAAAAVVVGALLLAAALDGQGNGRAPVAQDVVAPATGCAAGAAAAEGHVLGGTTDGHRWEFRLLGSPPNVTYEVVDGTGSGTVTHTPESWGRLVNKGVLTVLAVSLPDAALDVVAGDAPSEAEAVRVELDDGRVLEACIWSTELLGELKHYGVAFGSGAKVRRITIIGRDAAVLAQGMPPVVDPGRVDLPLDVDQ